MSIKYNKYNIIFIIYMSTDITINSKKIIIKKHNQNNQNNQICKYIENFFGNCIPNINNSNKIKIIDSEFILPSPCDYNKIIYYNYNVNQLKQIAKYYGLKYNYNKDFLIKQCYNYLYYSYYSIIIQKYWKRHITKLYIFYHGPGFKYKDKSVNLTDLLTLEYVVDIPYNQFFSFSEESGLVYAFDITSLYTWYNKNKDKNIIENPYTKNQLPEHVYNNMCKMIKYSNILNIEVNINIDNLIKLNKQKALDMRIFTVFQTIDSYGNYTDMSWFKNLSYNSLIKFLNELIDIWKYRANLSNDIKSEICPPNGSPFNHIDINNIRNYSYYQLKINIVKSIEILVNSGIDYNSRSLGALYVLTALTLVNNNAAETLPWLYESVN